MTIARSTNTRGGCLMFSRAAATSVGTERSLAVACCMRSGAGDDSIVIRLWTPSVIAAA